MKRFNSPTLTIFSSLIFFLLLLMRFLLHAEAFSHHNFKKIDPFNKNSEIRKGGRRIDPTNPNSETRRQLRTLDERRRQIMHVGRQGCIAYANSVIANNVNHRTNRWLTDQEKRYLRPWFARHINLDRVSVTWNAGLNNEMRVGGQMLWVASSAQTFGYRVFFREYHDTGNTRQLIGLSHELVHTVQAVRLGSIERFCEEYMNGWSNGFDYYNNHMEREAQDVAFRFARWLSQRLPSTGRYYKIEHGHPHNHRTVIVPHIYR